MGASVPHTTIYEPSIVRHERSEIDEREMAITKWLTSRFGKTDDFDTSDELV